MTTTMRGTLRAGTAALLVLGILLTGCGREKEEGPTYLSKSAEDQCGGLLSSAGVAALKRYMGADTMGGKGWNDLDGVVDHLRHWYGTGRAWSVSKNLCGISGPGDRSEKRMTARFSVNEPRPPRSGKLVPPAGLHTYALGTRAYSGVWATQLYFNCVSPELKGSDERPLRVSSGLSFAMSDSKGPDTRATWDASMTILHSLARAVAKELKCDGNGGLPEKPVIKPLD
ncbi:hypothetical protein ABT160_03470 [Streptomyces sp. NPDC001941]|uniref:hypothetical protein n=1 Tax=Streptomyces sp. NPDC001941 TaxID=3154659 RepID=UPI00331EDA53